jgi:hypothetical protein
MSFVKKAVKSVGKAVTSVVKGVVKAVTSVVKAVVNVAASVINFIAQPFMGLFGGKPDIPDAGAEAQRQQGVLIQTQGSNINIPVIYGYRKVGGAVVFAETGSTNNRYLYVAYVFAEGLVEGLREVFIDDWQLPVNLTADLNAGQVVDVNADRYSGRVRLQWYPGQYFDNPTQSPVGNSVKTGIFAEAPSFKPQMNFNGLAVMFARYEWKEIKTQEDSDNNPFGGSIPQLQISVLGKRVASLLVDTTEQQDYDRNLVRYSTNPAECLLDYLRNPRYGKGLKNSDIDWDSWKRAARKCNQTVTYLTTDSTIVGPILTMNYVLDTAQSIFANVKTMLSGFRAYMPYVQGKFKLRIEDAGNEYDILSGSAVIYQTITKDDIVGPVTYTGIEKSAKYNVVAINYVDPDQKWSVQQVIYPETQEERQQFINIDGGRENKLEATFPSITNYAIAKDMARLLFNKSRRQETCTITVTSKALELEPGDNIRIQSNILDFGTDPWRIISFKLNDNMTIELACVRNPDDIYPHVRVNEEDFVIPTYIPRGSIIYFPSSDNRIPLGLLPPINAIFPPGYTGTPTHPPNTDVRSELGGGVGGGSPPGGAGPLPPQGEPQVPPLVAVPPVNNPAQQPPPPPPYNSVLTLKSASTVDFGDGTFGFNVAFTQPNDALYQYTLVWIRPNAYSPWQQFRLDTIPGIGNEIPWFYGPAPESVYDAYARTFASDGRSSSSVLFFQLSSRADTRALGRTITGVSVREATEGWQLPAQLSSVASNYDDDIDLFEVRPKLVNGLPQDPRRLTVRIQQITNALSKPVNTLINGFRIYYRLASGTYFNYEDFKFPPNYIPGQVLNFDLQGDFGIRYSPADWSVVDPNSALYANQTYRFIVRLTYSDSTPAKKQLKPGNGRVEYSGGLFDFRTYGTLGNTIFSETIPAGFELLTVDQDPNKGFQEGLAVIPNIARIIPSNNANRITVNSNLPRDSNGNFFSRFIGNRIRFRRITPGSNPQFTVIETGRVATNDNIISTNITTGWEYGNSYQFVITSVFRDSLGEYESENSLVSDNVNISSSAWQFTTNVYDQFNFKIRNTNQALGQLRTSFPAIATVNPISWVRRQLQVPASFTGSTRDITRQNNQSFINNYFRFTFQPNPGSDTIVVYRRDFNILGVNRTTTASGFAKYWQLGPWEKVQVPLSSLPNTSDGFKVINLRGPIDHTYFEPYFEIQSNVTLVRRNYGLTGTWPNTGASPFLTGIFPYRTLGNNEATVSTNRRHEFLFVLKSGGTESPQGLLLRDFFTVESGTAWTSDVDGFGALGVARDQVVTVSSFNTFDAGYGRNITEALTGFSNQNIILPTLHTIATSPAVPALNTTFTQYNSFLNQPLNGDIVY